MAPATQFNKLTAWKAICHIRGMASPRSITLTEVAPFDRGLSPQSRKVLSPSERDLLLDAFAEQDGSAPAESAAHRLLEALWMRHLWLVCSCRGGSLASAPVLYVQSTRSSSRPLTIVRNHARALHDAQCPFIRACRPRGHNLAVRTKSQALGILKTAHVASAKSARAIVGAATSKTERTPSIANVLFTVLEHAGCNRFLGHPRSLTVDAQRVQEALTSFHMDGKKKIPAIDYFGTNLHRFGAISRNVERAAKKQEWPPNLTPHGFVIGLCEVERDKQKKVWLVEPKRGNSKPNRWQVTGRVRLPGPGTPGPNVAIGLIATPAGSQKPELVQAYVHPANSIDELTLVDSDLERQTLAILTEHLVEMKRKGKAYSVIKPYLDIVKSGARYRPDFLVIQGAKTLYIETMGYDDADYISRKEGVHEVMKSYHPVSQHFPGENDDAFRADVYAFIGFV